MRSNSKKIQARVRTHEGAPAIGLSPAKQLRRTVMAGMLFEDSYYETGTETAIRIADLVKRTPFADAAQCAIDARDKFKLRHMPLYIVREMLFHHGGRQMGDLIVRVIQRPDELGELLSLYWKARPDAPLDRQLKIGLARALKKFDEYQLAKHDSAERPVRVRDVLFLTHARPRDEAQAALFKRIANDAMSTPETWETKLSAGADSKETFTDLLTRRKLGAMALLRNLRKMLTEGVPEELIRNALFTARVDRVLPFRFLAAARHAPRLEDAIEVAMFKGLTAHPRLPGKTAVLVDHSGSMSATLSGKSEITRNEAAIGVAVLVREIAEFSRVFVFSDTCVEVAPRRGFALADAIRKSMHSGGTYVGAAIRKVYADFPDVDRLIVVTDEQSADRPREPQGRGYIINVGSYAHGIGFHPWVTIDGWSEAILDFIRLYEAEDETPAANA